MSNYLNSKFSLLLSSSVIFVFTSRSADSKIKILLLTDNHLQQTEPIIDELFINTLSSRLADLHLGVVTPETSMGKMVKQCTILIGYRNGIGIGQIFYVGIAKQIIHLLTQMVMSGTTFSKIGMIKGISTQADVATCVIIEDIGINTDVEVEVEKLPLARLVSN